MLKFKRLACGIEDVTQCNTQYSNYKLQPINNSENELRTSSTDSACTVIITRFSLSRKDFATFCDALPNFEILHKPRTFEKYHVYVE